MDAAQELLKEVETKLADFPQSEKILETVEKWICKTGNILAILATLKVSSLLVEKVLSQQTQKAMHEAINSAQEEQI
jgi:hypothetical protein